jgi:hypothetical protein
LGYHHIGWCTAKLVIFPSSWSIGAYWAIKQLNFNFLKAGSQRKLQLTELEELRNDDAYDSSRKYKEHMKKVHD